MPTIRLADLDITYYEKNAELKIVEEMFELIGQRFPNWPLALFVPLIRKILENTTFDRRLAKYIVGSKFSSDKKLVTFADDVERKDPIIPIDLDSILHLAVVMDDEKFLNCLLDSPREYGVGEDICYLLSKDNFSLLSVAVRLCSHPVVLRIKDLYTENRLLPAALKANGQHQALSIAIHQCSATEAALKQCQLAVVPLNTDMTAADEYDECQRKLTVAQAVYNQARDIFRLVTGAYHVTVPENALRARGFELFQVALRTQNLDLFREVISLYDKLDLLDAALMAPDRLKQNWSTSKIKSLNMGSMSQLNDTPADIEARSYWALKYVVNQADNIELVDFILNECFSDEERQFALRSDGFKVIHCLCAKTVNDDTREYLMTLTAYLLEHFERYADVAMDLIRSNEFALINFAVRLSNLDILDKVITLYTSMQSHEYKIPTYKSLMHEVLVAKQFHLLKTAIGTGNLVVLNRVRQLYEFVHVSDKKTAFQLALAQYHVDTELPLLAYVASTTYSNVEVFKAVVKFYADKPIKKMLPTLTDVFVNTDNLIALDIKWALVHILSDLKQVDLFEDEIMLLRHCLMESCKVYSLAELTNKLESLGIEALPESVVKYRRDSKDAFNQPYKLLTVAARYACVDIWEWILKQYHSDGREQVSYHLNTAMFGDNEKCVGFDVLASIFERNVADIRPMMRMLFNRVSTINIARTLVKIKQPVIYNKVIFDKREWRYELLKNVLVRSPRHYARIAEVMEIYLHVGELTSTSVQQLNELVDVVAFITFCSRNQDKYADLLIALLATRISKYNATDLVVSPRAYLLTLLDDKLNRELVFNLERRVTDLILSRVDVDEDDDFEFKAFAGRSIGILKGGVESHITHAAALDFIGCYEDYKACDPTSEQRNVALMRAERVMNETQAQAELQKMACQPDVDEPSLRPLVTLLRKHFAIDLKNLLHQYNWPLDKLILNSQQIISCVEQLQKNPYLKGFHYFTLFDLAILTGDARFVANIPSLPNVKWVWDGVKIAENSVLELDERALILAAYTDNIDMLELVKNHLSGPIENELLLFQLAVRNANLDTVNYVLSLIGARSQHNLLRAQAHVCLRLVIKNKHFDVIEHVINLYAKHGLLRDALRVESYTLLKEAVSLGDIFVLQRVIHAYRISGVLNEALKALDTNCLYTAIRSADLAVYDCIADLYSEKALKTMLLSDNIESLVIAAEVGNKAIYDKIFMYVERNVQTLVMRNDFLIRILSTNVPQFVISVIDSFKPSDVKKIFMHALYPNDKPNIESLLAVIKLANVDVLEWFVDIFKTLAFTKKVGTFSSTKYNLLQEFLDNEAVLTTAMQTGDCAIFNKVRHIQLSMKNGVAEEVDEEKEKECWDLILAALKSGQPDIFEQSGDKDIRASYCIYDAKNYEDALLAAIKGGSEQIISEVVTYYKALPPSAALTDMNRTDIAKAAFAQNNPEIVQLLDPILAEFSVADALFPSLLSDAEDVDKYTYCRKIAYILEHGSGAVINNLYREYYYQKHLKVSAATLIRFLVLEYNGDQVRLAYKLFLGSHLVTTLIQELSEREKMKSLLEQVMEKRSVDIEQLRPVSMYLDEVEVPVGEASIIEMRTRAEAAGQRGADVGQAAATVEDDGLDEDDGKLLVTDLLAHSVFPRSDAVETAAGQEQPAANRGHVSNLIAKAPNL